jgi:phenylacetate-coenzyme A ligase PaaK-like adenylate-forming protein
MDRQWNDKIFSVTPAGFEGLAVEIFHFQYQHNNIYRQYTDALGINPRNVQSINQIPFLPIRFFKSHTVNTGDFKPAVIFESSGTTGSINSRHLVKDAGLYTESFSHGFQQFYGNIKEYCILGLLPSYLERQNSSLVYMVNKLIGQSQHPDSGFYLDEFDKLYAILKRLEANKQKVLLIGVTFGLLDFAENYTLPLQHTIIMETGGMKGRRKEMLRQEVHDLLKESFKLSAIHSEYGMTELLSQAYSYGAGLFKSSPWMKILLRDEEDPLTIKKTPATKTETGAVNIIDFANIYSCCFIATDDAGRLYPDDSFEIIGRMDNSDIRGCSLMAV